MITAVHTIDIELGLIPGLTVCGLHTNDGVRLVAQNKYASFFVINSRTNDPFFLKGEDFVNYARFILGMEEIKLLFQKHRNSSKRGD